MKIPPNGFVRGHFCLFTFNRRECGKILYLLALFGKHSLVLGNKIIGEIFGMKVSCDIGDLPAALLEIFNGVLKKLIIIGLEAKLSARL